MIYVILGGGIIITINDRKVDVDIRRELEQYSFTRANWSHEKLIAASPFRYDTRPSFYVYLEDTATARAGDWGDSGAVDDEWTRGGFVKLLAFLRDESEEETREYLLAEYGWEYEDTDNLSLDLSGKLRVETIRQRLNPSLLDDYKWRHPYLSKRGISEGVQRYMQVGYDKRSQAVTIPWFFADGRLATVKYRKVNSKVFWYAKGGWPARELVYGINVIYKRKAKRAVLVESEIDALYLMTAGIPAIAVGGSKFSDKKRDIIAKSPIEELLIASDNDQAGDELRRKVIGKLTGYVDIANMTIPMSYKDVNDVEDVEKLRGYASLSKRVGIDVKI